MRPLKTADFYTQAETAAGGVSGDREKFVKHIGEFFILRIVHHKIRFKLGIAHAASEISVPKTVPFFN